MGYKLYRIIRTQEYIKPVQGEKYPITRLDVPDIETEEELVDKILALCLTTKLTLEDIRVLEEPVKLEGTKWVAMKEDCQK